MLIKTIIVSYNPAPWLNKCLDSLLNSNIPLDIIVIDNGSTDGSIEVIKSKYPSVNLIINKENKGFGAANNQGLSIALHENADFAFLLNQDAWIEPDTIEKLIEVSGKNKYFGVLSPIHLNGKGDALDKGFAIYSGLENRISFTDLVSRKTTKQVYEVPFVNAAAWLITKECLETIGGFNPSFFHYGEDNNYCERVQYHGLRIGVVPNAFIYHDREQRTKNPYFDNFKKSYSKSIISQLSLPDKSQSKPVAEVLFKDMIKQLLKLRLNNAFSILGFLKETNFKKIRANQKASLTKGPSFLKQFNV